MPRLGLDMTLAWTHPGKGLIIIESMQCKYSFEREATLKLKMSVLLHPPNPRLKLSSPKLVKLVFKSIKAPENMFQRKNCTFERRTIYFLWWNVSRRILERLYWNVIVMLCQFRTSHFFVGVHPTRVPKRFDQPRKETITFACLSHQTEYLSAENAIEYFFFWSAKK